MRKKQTGEEKDESQSDKEEDAVVKDSVDTSPVTASPGPTISREMSTALKIKINDPLFVTHRLRKARGNNRSGRTASVCCVWLHGADFFLRRPKTAPIFQEGTRSWR